MIARLLIDARVAARTFARQPFFTATTIATLAVGIGATTAMFGVVDAAVLRPLAYPDADRIVSLVQKDPRFGTVPFAPPYLDDLRERMRTVERVAGFSPSWQMVFTGGGDARVVTAAYVSDGLFDLFGAAAVRGRIFTSEEHAPGGPAVALVSERFWRQQFGEGAGLSGQTIRLDARPYTIVGTMADDLRMPITSSTVTRQARRAEVWLPFALNPYAAARSIPVMNVVGRLREAATTTVAQEEIAAVGASLARDYPAASAGAMLLVAPLRELVSRDVRAPLLVLLGAVGLLLVLACANVGHMLLARAAGRDGEMAVRASLGATPGRLTAQLLAESATLAAAGTGVGLILSWWALGAIAAFGFAGLPPSAEVRFDWRVASFAAGAAIFTTLLTGIVPAVRASRRMPFDLLRDGARLTDGRGARLRDALVFAEVALAVVLLVGAGLLARSFFTLTSIDPGFSGDRVLAGSVALPAAKYDNAASRAFVDEALSRLSNVPGADRAALVNRLPFGGGNVLVGVELEGLPQPDGKPIVMDRRVVSPGYFTTMGIPLLDGEDFGIEHRADAKQPVAIVNATVAQRFWPGENALGRRVRLMLRSGPGPWLRIVGVVGDVRHHGLDQPLQPEVYVPYAQAPVGSFVLLLRASGDPTQLAPRLRATLRALDGDLPVDPIGTAAEAIRASVAEPRLRTTLLNAFAGVALALAAMGVYGLLSFSVARSTREIGVRIALGAQRHAIVRLVLARGMTLVAGGAAAGLVASLALSRYLDRLLFGVTPTDPATFGAVTTVLLAVGLAACYVPARRAMRLDPVQALRLE
jgi:predicted permease